MRICLPAVGAGSGCRGILGCPVKVRFLVLYVVDLEVDSEVVVVARENVRADAFKRDSELNLVAGGRT